MPVTICGLLQPTVMGGTPAPPFSCPPPPPHPPPTHTTHTPHPCRYYSTLGPRQLADVLDVAGPHVDCVKFARGSFMVMPEQAVREIIDLAHAHKVGAPQRRGMACQRILSSMVTRLASVSQSL
jgi:hypothetical protein